MLNTLNDDLFLIVLKLIKLVGNYIFFL